MITIIFILHITIASILASDQLGIAEDCPRIRRAWHTLTQEDRDLYISGLLQLRANGNGDIDTDEFIAIASVHEDQFAPVTHKASSYLFWHGYLLWELETRIRNLGGQYSCFGMPYWDYTMESGREDNPSIFDTGLGANGDINNYYTVNGYSWDITTDDFWVPYNCYAHNDEYPICSLKRALRDPFTMPTAHEIGRGIMDNPDFIKFAKWYATSYNPVHLFTGTTFLQSPFPVTTSYDPIWYLFHSMVQYHQAMWTDCNEYDLIDPNDLDNHPDAYQPYCVHGTCGSDKDYPLEWTKMGLDDAMHFGGSLEEKKWSYIHSNSLTVRDLYHLPRWGIVYDLGNEGGFYERSGLNEYCKGKLNNRWFITNADNPYAKNEEDEQVMVKSTGDYINGYITYNSIFIVGLSLVVAVICVLCYIAMRSRKTENERLGFHSYGAVY